MIVCDRQQKGKSRIARYELILKDRFSDKVEKPRDFGGGQEYGKHDIFPIRKDLCTECAEMLAAIINAFTSGGEFGKENYLDQITKILADKTEEIEKQKEVQVGREDI